jgi:hypothetical protein
MPAKRNDLQALRSLIGEAERILATTELPEGRAARARELLQSAIALADALMEIQPAAVLGAKGGKVTAKRGAEYFKKIAGMRKTWAGGRPRKTS